MLSKQINGIKERIERARSELKDALSVMTFEDQEKECEMRVKIPFNNLYLKEDLI